jgi:hypothetical protein
MRFSAATGLVSVVATIITTHQQRSGETGRQVNLRVVAAVVFVSLHAPGVGDIDISPGRVVTLRTPPIGFGRFVADVHCVVYTDDGNYIAVVEACAEVRRKLEKSR